MSGFVTTSLLILGLISTAQGITFDEAIKNGSNTGLIRLGYISFWNSHHP